MHNPAHIDIKNTIIDAAQPLFAEHGLYGTTLSAVAESANVNQQEINKHFGSKLGLWRATFTRTYQRYIEREATSLEAVNRTNDGTLRSAIEHYFYFLRDNPEVVRLHSWLFLENKKQPKLGLDQLIAMGDDRLKEGQERGMLRDDVPTPFFILLFIGAAQGWFQMQGEYADYLAEQLPNEEEDIDEAFLDAFLKIYFEGARKP